MTDAFDRLKNALADRYTLERELGAGGMATVYLAEDVKLHRKVAVKVLRPELAAALGPDRFLQEIDIAAKLNHPHILGLFDCGEADGFLYYVMPYIEGESLREKLAKEGELPVTDAVRILKEVVDALAEAHSSGVVHRDIKPDNIMLRGRHALVTDFGVAKAISEATGRQKLTTEGIALGTPAYMSPEQAAADPHIDHRSDIYAVGAVAYELLTGRPPFTGTTQQEILAAHVTQAADPVTKYRESVPPALEQLVQRCLEKKPADRWQTAAELIPQLEALATPSGGVMPTGVAPSSTFGSNRSWGRLRTVVPTVVLIAVLAIAIGRGILGGWGGGERAGDTDVTRVAVLPFTSRSPDTTNAFLAEALAEQIGVRIGRLEGLHVLSAAAITAQVRRTPDPIEAAQALDADMLVTGSLRLAMNDLYAHVELVNLSSGAQAWASTLTRNDGDLAALEQQAAESVAVALVGTVAPSETVVLRELNSENQEAYRLFLLGNAFFYRRTAESVIRAIEHYSEAVQLDPSFSDAWGKLGLARTVQISWPIWPTDVPRDSLPELAQTAINRTLALDSLSVVAWSADGVLALWTNEDLSRARTSLERALQLDTLNAETLGIYGSLLGDEFLNDLPRAEQVLRRSIDMEPDRQNTWRKLAVVLSNQGRLAASEFVLDTIVALGEWAPAYYSRAYVRFLRGNGVGALADVSKAEPLMEMDFDWSRIRALYRIAVGDSQPAHAWLEEHYGNERNNVDSNWIAYFSIALGLQDEALAALEAMPTNVHTWALLHNPIFAPLHENPRYLRLLEETRPEGHVYE